MSKEEKEWDGFYAEDDKDDHVEEAQPKMTVQLKFSQKIHQLACRIKRFAESLDTGESFEKTRKKLIK